MVTRRAFLQGVSATAVAAALPAAAPIVEYPLNHFAINYAAAMEYQEALRKAINEVYALCEQDLLCYGTSAYRQVDTFPFVEHVSPHEIFGDPWDVSQATPTTPTIAPRATSIPRRTPNGAVTDTAAVVAAAPKPKSNTATEPD